MILWFRLFLCLSLYKWSNWPHFQATIFSTGQYASWTRPQWPYIFAQMTLQTFHNSPFLALKVKSPQFTGCIFARWSQKETWRFLQILFKVCLYLSYFPNSCRVTFHFGNLGVIFPNAHSSIIRDTCQENIVNICYVLQDNGVKYASCVPWQFLQKHSRVNIPDENTSEDGTSCYNSPLKVYVAWINYARFFFANHRLSLFIFTIWFKWYLVF